MRADTNQRSIDRSVAALSSYGRFSKKRRDDIPSDREAHASKIAALTKQEPEQSAEDKWRVYLESLAKRGLLADAIKQSAQRILIAIAEAMPGTVPPHAILTEDGQLRMYWNRNGRYLEIIVAATTFEWSYTDTDGVYDDSPDIPSTEPLPSKLLDRITLV